MVLYVVCLERKFGDKIVEDFEFYLCNGCSTCLYRFRKIVITGNGIGLADRF
jgi:hypothetical protein